MGDVLDISVVAEIAQSKKGTVCCAVGVWFIDEVEHLALFFPDGERRIYIDGAVRDTSRIKDQLCSHVTTLQLPDGSLHHLLYCSAGTLFCTAFEDVTNVAALAASSGPSGTTTSNEPSQKVLAEDVQDYAVNGLQTAIATLHKNGNVHGMDIASWTRTFTWTPEQGPFTRVIFMAEEPATVCVHGVSGGITYISESNNVVGVEETGVRFPGGSDLVALSSEEVLLVKDSFGFVLSGENAKPLRREEESIQWPSPPLEVAVCGPFVAARLKSCVQFHLWLTGELLKEVEAKAEHVCACGDMFFYVSMTDGRVLRLDAASEGSTDFRRTLRIREAWKACGREFDEETAAGLHADFAKKLFREGDFAAAVEQLAPVDEQQVESVMKELLSGTELHPGSAVAPETVGSKTIREFVLPVVVGQERTGKRVFLDTLLLKALVMDGDVAGNAMGLRKRDFIRGQNLCDVEECERLLLHYPDMWEDLLWLYMSKNMHTKALEWLRKLDENQDERPSKYVTKAVEYLRRLGRASTKIVVRFAPWVLAAVRPKEAISIFVRPPPNVEPLESSVVMDLLEMHDRRMMEHAAAAKDAGEVEVERETISILYLRYLVKQDKEPRVKIHTRLALLLLQLYMQCVAVSSPHTDVVRSDLTAFLKSSKHYAADDLIPHFKQTELFHEYALLLSRVGRHQEALRIYTVTLNAHAEALDYCSMVAETHPSIFMELFDLYMEQKTQKSTEHAVKVLEVHHMHMDVTAAMTALGDTIPLHTVVNFISAAITHEAATHRSKQVLKQLLRRQHLDVMNELALLQRKHCVVSRKTTCANPVCQRKFQSDSAIARLPDGRIMHYACLGKDQRRPQ